MAKDHSTLLGDHPADFPAGVAAYAAAGLSVVAVTALGAMFAVEVPRGGPYVFGAINDFTGGLFFLAAIPPILQVDRRLGPGPGTRVGAAAVAACSAAAALSGILISVHLVDFVPSTAVSVGGIIAQAVWAAAANHRLLRRPRFPRRLALAGRAIGAGMLAAFLIGAAGFLAAGVPALQLSLYAVGLVLGVPAYLAWPVWLFAAGRHLTGHAERAHRRRPAARPA